MMRLTLDAINCSYKLLYIILVYSGMCVTVKYVVSLVGSLAALVCYNLSPQVFRFINL